MGYELSKAEASALSVDYDIGGERVTLDLPFVRKYLVRGSADLVSDQEVVFFINLCKAQKLNPLVGSEVYLIKYSKSDPAQVVVGKSAYMKRAFEHPDYLCKEDGITVQRGDKILQKEGCCLYPGEKLIGGWCRVHYMRNGKERTAYKEVALGEYDKGQANWKSKPATMIDKVAVSQCVREAFPKDYEGLYSEDEMVASGAIPADYEEVKTPEAQTSSPEDEVISKDQRQAYMEKIQNAFPTGRSDRHVQILTELGITSLSKMTVGLWHKAMERIDTLASEVRAVDVDTVDVNEAENGTAGTADTETVD